MDAPDPEQPRRDVPFTWISSQRGRSARAGRRRWADLRGPLLAAAMLGLLQAGLVGLALEAFSALDVRAIGVVPVVAIATFLLVLFLGAHWMSCLWFWVGFPNGRNSGKSVPWPYLYPN